MMGPGPAGGNAGVEMPGFRRGMELVMCILVCFRALGGNWMGRECSTSELHTCLYLPLQRVWMASLSIDMLGQCLSVPSPTLGWMGLGGPKAG